MTDLKAYEYVLAVVRTGGISAAAEALGIAQPTLSRYIKKLEDELGMPLFDRSTSPLRLTEVGEAYIKAAEDISQIEQQMENYINDLHTLKSGHLSIGASNLFAAYALPPIITEFKKKFPDINIQMTEFNTVQLEELLGNNSLDLVFDNNHYDNILYDRG